MQAAGIARCERHLSRDSVPGGMDVVRELRIAGKELTAKFPPKAVDCNKLDDTDGFWDLKIEDAKRLNALSFRPKDMGDIIFLNMAAMGWEDGRREL
jgi:hypothetical protein